MRYAQIKSGKNCIWVTKAEQEDSHMNPSKEFIHATKQMINGYTSTADELVRRISALIHSHPEILEMDDAFSLFGVGGFKCDDLEPSLFQAQWALIQAKAAASTVCSGRRGTARRESKVRQPRRR